MISIFSSEKSRLLLLNVHSKHSTKQTIHSEFISYGDIYPLLYVL